MLLSDVSDDILDELRRAGCQFRWDMRDRRWWVKTPWLIGAEAPLRAAILDVIEFRIASRLDAEGEGGSG